MDRKRKLYLNIGSSLVRQLAVFICGFILPRYLLLYFGSDVNGLLTSLARFLGLISFLELGIGPVVQSNLYKPLEEKDPDTVSKILVSAEKFYHRIAYIFLGYIAILAVGYPLLNREFDFWFTASLLLIISLGTFAQYYFGITWQVLLTADQKAYVPNLLQTVSVILNTLLCVILMQAGCGVHLVKLASAAVFVLRPIVLNFYVRKHYAVNRKITYDGDPIQQRWNGFAQHLAAAVCGEIDVILLTFLATYQSVSVYSVYVLVVGGLANLIINATGFESFWGNMLARGETDLLSKSFDGVETLLHFIVTTLFSAAAILITPFVSVYVRGIEDAAAYHQPLFGIILAVAFGMRCARLPYNMLVNAAGHYKQTQNGAFVSMGINIVLSLALIRPFGLVGVAIGTLAAMLYHTLYFGWYLRKNIIRRPLRHMLCHLFTDAAVGVLAYFATKRFTMSAVSYGAWILYAFKVTLVVLGSSLLLHAVLYRGQFRYLLEAVRRKTARAVREPDTEQEPDEPRDTLPH